MARGSGSLFQIVEWDGKVIWEHPERMDPNFDHGVNGSLFGDWMHTSSFDYNEFLDQVVINTSTFSEFYVIDHGGHGRSPSEYLQANRVELLVDATERVLARTLAGLSGFRTAIR